MHGKKLVGPVLAATISPKNLCYPPLNSRSSPMYGQCNPMQHLVILSCLRGLPAAAVGSPRSCVVPSTNTAPSPSPGLLP